MAIKVHKDRDDIILQEGDRVEWVNPDGTVNMYCDAFPYEGTFTCKLYSDNEPYIAWGDGEIMPFGEGTKLTRDRCVRKKSIGK